MIKSLISAGFAAFAISTTASAREPGKKPSNAARPQNACASILKQKIAVHCSNPAGYEVDLQLSQVTQFSANDANYTLVDGANGVYKRTTRYMLYKYPNDDLEVTINLRGKNEYHPDIGYVILRMAPDGSVKDAVFVRYDGTGKDFLQLTCSAI